MNYFKQYAPLKAQMDLLRSNAFSHIMDTFLLDERKSFNIGIYINYIGSGYVIKSIENKNGGIFLLDEDDDRLHFGLSDLKIEDILIIADNI